MNEKNMTTEFSRLLQDNLSTLNMKTGDLVPGVVLSIDNDFVILGLSSKSEGFVSVDEFKDLEGQLTIEVGEKVEVMLETIENGFGETCVSKEKAEKAAVWIKLEDFHQQNAIISGKVLERVRGGFTVEIDKVRAFLPGSLVDVRPLKSPGEIENKTLDFKIVKMDKKRNNIVVSRKAVLIEESTEEREGLLSSIKEGQEVTGIVKNLTDYGAFIDLGGIDGLLHITDISWKRVKHPSHVVKVGETVVTKVLNFDREKLRVSLGLKQMSDDPWVGITGKYPVKTRLAGKVTNITDYGCFVEIQDGIEGLVHMSELDWKNKNLHPSKIVQENDEVEVMVLEISEEKRRISLGIKQCKENPWETFTKEYQKGSKLKGKIKSITDFGLFVGIDGGIDGLVHLTDIDWKQSDEQVLRNYEKGQEIDVVVISIDSERGRISLGIKQLSENPLDSFMINNKVGSSIKGNVLEVDKEKAIVDLGENIKGLMNLSEFDKEVKQSDTVEAYITSFDKSSQKVYLSLFMPKPSKSSSKKAVDNEPERATFADLLKDKVNLKEDK
jgi:small subunit ribosomal protein S1